MRLGSPSDTQNNARPTHLFLPTLSSVLLKWIRNQYPTVVSTLVAFVVCAFRMGERQLGDDETCSWWTVHLSPPDLFRLLERLDAVLAPYYLLLHGWAYLFGDSEIALRLPSTIAMAIAAGLIARVGERLGNADTGLFAGLYFAVIPAVSSYAQETRPYAIAVAASTGACLLLLRAIETPNRLASWTAYASAIACVGIAHLVSLSCLFGHAIALLVAKPRPPWFAFRPRFFWRWTAAVTVGLLPVVPLAWLGSKQSSQIRPTVHTTEMLAQLHKTLPMSLEIGWLLIGLATVALLRRRTHVILLLTWAILPPVTLYLSYDWLHLFRARYLLFTLPAWTLLAALATTQLPLPRYWSKGVPLLILGAIVVFGWKAQVTMRHPKPDSLSYRIAGQLLRKRAMLDDAVAFGGPAGRQYHLRLGLAYAMRHDQPLRDVFALRKASIVGKFRPVECKDVKQCPLNDVNRLWLLTPGRKRVNLAELEQPKADLLDSQFIIRRAWPVGHCMLSLLERRNGDTTTPAQLDPQPSDPLDVEPPTDDAEP